LILSSNLIALLLGSILRSGSHL